MQERTWIRRCMLVAMSALILAAGAFGDGGEVYAKKSSSKKKSNDATVTILGATTRQTTCEGKLNVEVRYTVNDEKTKTVSAPIDKSGYWSVAVPNVEKGWFEATANIKDHPKQSTLYWDDAAIEVRRGRDEEIDMGRLRVQPCS